MSASLGVNLRVTGHCSQGGRKYMEDVFSVAYQQTDDEKDLEYAFFGIFDGHGGKEAAQFAKDNLMDAITKNKMFWSEDDDEVLKAIREGFLSVQQLMWNELPNWKKTSSGLPSTAGTTASVCFIKRGKLFIGHVGDSGIILGEKDPHQPTRWRARTLTREHKPESDVELKRIESCGGKVVAKAGVPRIVWFRPTQQGPVRRSTSFEEVPFLAVARALGDLWSYNAKSGSYIVSPDPDLHVYDIDVLKDRCLVLATDGVWNVLTPDMAVQEVFGAEKNNERHMLDPDGNGNTWVNPSKRLVDFALKRWDMCQLRADNTTIVTVMLDPPGPPRAQVLRKMYSMGATSPASPQQDNSPGTKPASNQLQQDSGNGSSSKSGARQQQQTAGKGGGIAIISRFPNSNDVAEKEGRNLVKSKHPRVENHGSTSSGNANRQLRNQPVEDSVSSLEQLKLTRDRPKSDIGPFPTSVATTAKVAAAHHSHQSVALSKVSPTASLGSKEASRKDNIASSISALGGGGSLKLNLLKHDIVPKDIKTWTEVGGSWRKTAGTGGEISGNNDGRGRVLCPPDHKELTKVSPSPPPVPRRSQTTSVNGPPGGSTGRGVLKRKSLSRELADLQSNASSMKFKSGVGGSGSSSNFNGKLLPHLGPLEDLLKEEERSSSSDSENRQPVVPSGSKTAAPSGSKPTSSAITRHEASGSRNSRDQQHSPEQGPHLTGSERRTVSPPQQQQQQQQSSSSSSSLPSRILRPRNNSKAASPPRPPVSPLSSRTPSGGGRRTGKSSSFKSYQATGNDSSPAGAKRKRDSTVSERATSPLALALAAKVARTVKHLEKGQGDSPLKTSSNSPAKSKVAAASAKAAVAGQRNA